MCREKEDKTLVKRPRSSLSPATSTKSKEVLVNTLQLPVKSWSSPKAVTPAEAILAEESQETCQVCQTEIDGERNKCSYCLARCHNECMLKGHSMFIHFPRHYLHLGITNVCFIGQYCSRVFLRIQLEQLENEIHIGKISEFDLSHKKLQKHLKNASDLYIEAFYTY